MSGLDLELSNEARSTFVDLASSASNFIQDYIFGLKSEPISSSNDLKYPNADELHALAQPLEAKSTINERGTSMQDILSHLGQVMQTGITKSSHAGHVAFINGGGILAGAIGAMLASALHVQTGLWAECPSMIALEESVLQWMASMIGYPSTSSQGIITSGGSTTLLTAMICARHRYLPVELMHKGVMYITEQSNCSVHKSAKLLGLSKHQIRVISVDEDHRMNLDELVNTIEKDLGEGLKPFMIVGNAGTTDTGKIDDLAGINTIACKYDLWFHVDACYGGFFALTERGKELLKGIELADSVSLDPHKSLFMPLGYGVLLVKEGSALREAMSRPGPSPYLSNIYHITNYCDLSMELSRPNRGLPLWFALKLHGVNAFRTALQEKLDLAQMMCEQISQIENVEVISQPELTTFTFRYFDSDLGQSTLNMLNKTLVSLINQQQVIFVNSTIIKQKNVIRICVMNHRTHMQDISNGVEAIRTAIQEVQLLARNKHNDNVHARVDDAKLTHSV